MGELYERLLGEVKTLADYAPQPSGALAALLAVLELHKPRDIDGVCSAPACDVVRTPWQRCSTVRAIARALDVPIGEK